MLGIEPGSSARAPRALKFFLAPSPHTHLFFETGFYRMLYLPVRLHWLMDGSQHPPVVILGFSAGITAISAWMDAGVWVWVSRTHACTILLPRPLVPSLPSECPLASHAPPQAIYLVTRQAFYKVALSFYSSLQSRSMTPWPAEGSSRSSPHSVRSQVIFSVLFPNGLSSRSLHPIDT